MEKCRADKNIIGKKINKLTILDYAFSTKGHSYWKCECECGNTKNCERSALLSGRYKTCGKGSCSTKKINAKGINNPNFSDLTNKKFNRLTVINLNSFDNGAYWNCECDCKKMVIVKGANLTSGNVKSCGCLKGENKIIDITGEKIGTYRIIKRVKSKKKKHGKLIGCWECLCDCGNINYLFHDELMISKFGCKKCYSENFRGELHPRWNSSLTTEDRVKRRSLPELKEWRDKVYQRDGYTCQVSGIKGGKLCAHHLESWHANKDLRFDLTNGITILESVHKHFHRLYGRKNNTKQQFEEFVKNLTQKEIKQLIKQNERKTRKKRKN